MKHDTESSYFVIPHGETREESWSWEEVEAMCRRGGLSAEARIFMPDTQEWVRAGDTELAELFPDFEEEQDCEAGLAPAQDEREIEYAEALGMLREEPGSVQLLVTAGALAADLDKTDESRKHFQEALELRPFDPSVAGEVKRRFPRSQRKSFKYLERLESAWDDPAELLSFPLARGPVYLAAVALVAGVCFALPQAGVVLFPLCYAWLVQVVRSTAEGVGKPPLWHHAVSRPVTEIVLPVVAGAVVAGLSAAVVLGVGQLGILIDGASGVGPLAYVKKSPLITVMGGVLAAVYLPLLVVAMARSLRAFARVLVPWKAAIAVMDMEQEYLQTAATVFALVFACGGVFLLFGGIPVVGTVVCGAVGGYALLMTGFMLGRLLNRVRHAL